MHDLKALRDNPAFYDAGWARRGLEPQTPAILEIDARLRAAKSKRMDAEAIRNSASKAIGAAKAQKNETEATRLMEEVARAKVMMEEATAEEIVAQKELDTIIHALPNLPDATVPEGADEAGNVEEKRWGNVHNFAFTPKDHVALGEGLGLMDFEGAARMSGSRFVVLKGGLARLERALGQFMLDQHVDKNGYSETNAPILVRDRAMFGTGQLPKFEDDLFKIYSDSDDVRSRIASVKAVFETLKPIVAESESFADQIEKLIQLIVTRKSEIKTKMFHESFEHSELYRNEIEKNDNLLKVVFELSEKERAANTMYETKIEQIESKVDLLRGQIDLLSQEGMLRHWLIPTSEVSVTNTVREQILEDESLPRRMAALSPCFRSEAGSAGRDTRGMIRQHQFWKVELVSVTAPETSVEEHLRMTACAEGILEALNLPYRRMLLCTGDMGFSAQRTYDLEVWLPGQNDGTGAYREISSCSNCGDFQARRMDTRTRPKGEKATRFVHTLNGSGLAVGRTLVAVLENYQNDDGSITVPEVLLPYMGGVSVISP
jgi:seryl-tRNA synthetase